LIFVGRVALASPLALLSMSGLAHAEPTSASPQPTAPTVQVAEEDSRPGATIGLRLTPPLAEWNVVNPAGTSGLAIGFGRVAIGVITRDSLWFEASFGLLHGLETVGWNATAAVGYALDRNPVPGEWDFSLPVFIGYGFADRPGAHASDGYAVTEQLHLVLAGTRAVWSRQNSWGAIELGVGIHAGVPIARREPTIVYSSEVPTDLWVGGMGTFGVLFDAS
jgi:hypothetical protein